MTHMLRSGLRLGRSHADALGGARAHVSVDLAEASEKVRSAPRLELKVPVVENAGSAPAPDERSQTAVSYLARFADDCRYDVALL